MIVYKRVFSRVFFALECLFFVWVYVYGKHGVCALMHIHRDYENVTREIIFLEKEIETLQKNIELFKTNPFYLEKKVRETLVMSRSDEMILFIDENKESRDV